jgi:hypothetical protein
MTVPYTFATAASPLPLSQLDANFAAVGASANITYTLSTTGAVTRSVSSKLSDWSSVKDFGATGNGSTDDSSYLTAANAASFILIPTGTYVVSSNVTFSSPVQMLGGAILQIATGVTVTFNAGLSAGIYQIFNCSGTGKVVINSQFLNVGYPEWWGAITNTGADCLAAINACVVACNVTQLQAADYAISSTLKMTTPNRTLQGQGFNYLGSAGSATRIILTSGSSTTLQIGTDTAPGGGINAFLTDVTVQNLQVTRSVDPVNGSGATGLLMQFALYCYVKQVKAAEHEYGFHYTACVSCHTLGCYSFRSTAGTGGGTAVFWGYYIDGVSNTSFAAGGNASIYFDENNASAAGSCPSNSAGFYLNGNFTDCYIARAESNGMAYGIAVIGNNLTTQQYGNNDLLITSCVIDVFTIAGILFQNTSKFGSISVNGGYCAAATGSTEVTGLYFNSSLAQVSVTDFQTIGNSSSTCTGITAINSANIETKTQIIDVNSQAISMTNTTNSRFLDHVTNYGDTAGAMCQLAGGCNRNYLQVFAAGKSSAFTIGYQLLGTTNNYNEINCTGIDPACINSGSGNKLIINGSQVTSTGLSGTNLVSGVMA